jgi:hypothetical protein
MATAQGDFHASASDYRAPSRFAAALFCG